MGVCNISKIEHRITGNIIKEVSGEHSRISIPKRFTNSKIMIIAEPEIRFFSFLCERYNVIESKDYPTIQIPKEYIGKKLLLVEVVDHE